MSSIEDLLQSAVEQKPVEFMSTFNDLLVNKLQTAVENKKAEIAQNMFSIPQQETEVNSEE